MKRLLILLSAVAFMHGPSLSGQRCRVTGQSVGKVPKRMGVPDPLFGVGDITCIEVNFDAA